MRPALKWLIAAAVLGLTAAFARADLRVEGETKLLVTKLPFNVVSDDLATIYLWDVPAGWKADKGLKTLAVSAAPDGEYTVGLQLIRLTLNKDGTTESTTVLRKLVVCVKAGAGPPTPPGPRPNPNPTPGPDAGFVAALKAAYARETVPGKDALMKGLANVYAACADELSGANGGRFGTWGTLPGLLEAAAKAEGVLDKLRVVDVEIVKRLTVRLGVDPGAQPARPLTADDRLKVAAEFRTVSAAVLEAVK